MAGIILPDGAGVNRKAKKVPFTDLSGIQRTAKTGWLGCPDGVTRKIFSAFDAQASNYTAKNDIWIPYPGVAADGSLNGGIYRSYGTYSAQGWCICKIILPDTITLIPNSTVIAFHNVSANMTFTNIAQIGIETYFTTSWYPDYMHWYCDFGVSSSYTPATSRSVWNARDVSKAWTKDAVTTKELYLYASAGDSGASTDINITAPAGAISINGKQLANIEILPTTPIT